VTSKTSKHRARRTPRRRRGTRYAVDRRRRAIVAAGAGTAGIVATAAWLTVNGWFAQQIESTGRAALEATARAGLKVEDVLVEGRRRTARSAILESLGVARDTPILALDPHAARRRLEALPWVRRATVERRLPDTVFVRLVERRPLAVWQYRGRLAVIDEDGAVIPGARAEAFADLPLVVGKDAPADARALIAMLDSEPDLRRRVIAAVRMRARRWDVQLEGGVSVRLPEDDPARAWTELARIEREHAILARDVITIDLRLPDRLIVRTAPGAKLRRNDTGKET